MGDGVVPLERDYGEREDGQLRAQHPEEARELAADGELPGDGVLAELAQGARVQHRQEPCNMGASSEELRRHVIDSNLLEYNFHSQEVGQLCIVFVYSQTGKQWFCCLQLHRFAGGRGGSGVNREVCFQV